MNSNGIAKLSKDLGGGENMQEVQEGFVQTLSADVSAELDTSVDERFDAGTSHGAEHQRTSLLEVGRQSANEQFDANSFDGEGDQKKSSLLVANKSLDEQLDEGSSRGAEATEHQRTNLQLHSSILEISELKESSTPRLRWGSDHSITAPVGTHKNLFLESHGIGFSRSMTEKREIPKHDLKLDRLSEREKEKFIANLVKIQNDGTVEVDLAKNVPVASEWLELHSVEGTPTDIDYITTEFNKSVPRLKISILVVGTRGDVQPFLAMAKRLQEFGHHVRLATHTNFRTFVKASGVEFYPLGGDPRVLAGYMARNKGFIPSAPGEISKQRKQLKAIIESLLPACIEADESGEPFRAQAIIANPPAYGHSGGMKRPLQ